MWTVPLKAKDKLSALVDEAVTDRRTKSPPQ